MISRKPLYIFFSVQKALFLRELSTRLSSSKMGIFWTFFEPFMQIMIFIIIRFVFLQGDSSSFDFAVFLALNFTAFNLFKNIITKSMNAFSANKALFVYKQVKPLDTIIARTIVEIFITSIIILIFFSLGYYFDFNLNVKNLPMVTAGIIWITFFGLSLSILLTIANTFFPSIQKIVSISTTFLMFTSAIFFTMSTIPLELQHFLLYNPLVHFMEMIHGFYFYALDDRYVNYLYMGLWTVIPFYLGLILYKKLEKSIISL